MGAHKKTTIELDRSAVRRLRVIFDVDTDKEAVNKAIQLVAAEDEIIKTHESLAERVELEDIFG